jgi:hypothetical protein
VNDDTIIMVESFNLLCGVRKGGRPHRQQLAKVALVDGRVVRLMKDGYAASFGVRMAEGERELILLKNCPMHRGPFLFRETDVIKALSKARETGRASGLLVVPAALNRPVAQRPRRA